MSNVLTTPLPEAVLKRIPYARHLGIERQGEHFVLAPDRKLIGNVILPALHGGAVAGFLEIAAQLFLILRDPDSRYLPKIIDFSIDYLRSARLQPTYASCELERSGRRVALVRIRCWQEAPDKPVALARAQFLWEAAESSDQVTL